MDCASVSTGHCCLLRCCFNSDYIDKGIWRYLSLGAVMLQQMQSSPSASFQMHPWRLAAHGPEAELLCSWAITLGIGNRSGSQLWLGQRQSQR